MTIDETSHLPKAAFTVENDVTSQVDFMYTTLVTNMNKGSGSVNLNFKHALTRLKFQTKLKSNVPAGADLSVTLNSITLKGINNAASFDFKTKTWEAPTGNATHYDILSSGNVAITSTAVNLWDNDTDINTNTPLMIPKTLTTDLQLVVSYTQAGVTVEKTLTLEGSTAWTANKSILYTIVFGPGNPITFLAEATGWDNSGTPVEPMPVVTAADIVYDEASSTYEIKTAEGLKAFADLVNGNYNIYSGPRPKRERTISTSALETCSSTAN